MSTNAALFSALSALSNNIVKILKVNLEADCFEVIKIRNSESADILQTPDKLNEYLMAYARQGYVHPEDTNLFLSNVNLDFLRDYFAKYSDIWRIRYRRRSGDEYIWAMMEMRPTENFSHENRELYLYVYEVDRELASLYDREQKLAEQRLFNKLAYRVLNAGFWRIYYDENGKEIKHCFDEGYGALLGFGNVDERITDPTNRMGLVHPDDVNALAEKLEKLFSGDEPVREFEHEYRTKHSDGEYHWLRVAGELTCRADGTPVVLSGLAVDITAKKEYINSMEKVIEMNSRLEDALQIEHEQHEIISAVSKIYNTLHVIDLVNNKYSEVQASTMVGTFLRENSAIKDNQELLHGAMRHTVLKDFLPSMLEFTDLSTIPERLHGKSMVSCEYIGYDIGWGRASFFPVKTDENGYATVVIFATMIIEEEKRREQKLIHIAKTDELTGLYNRRAYDDDIADAERRGIGRNMTVVSVDVNGLKNINDTQGHAAGDELIQHAAKCMMRVFGVSGRAYRTGGDEFVALVECSERELQEYIAELNDLAGKCKGRYITDGVSLAVGYASKKEFPEADMAELERCSDKRMYDNKDKHYVECGIERRKN
ncbi:MAG: diguanylate cyclase domain-containing protein [Oscillospiraceae bacterium]